MAIGLAAVALGSVAAVASHGSGSGPSAEWADTIMRVALLVFGGAMTVAFSLAVGAAFVARRSGSGPVRLRGIGLWLGLAIVSISIVVSVAWMPAVGMSSPPPWFLRPLLVLGLVVTFASMLPTGSALVAAVRRRDPRLLLALLLAVLLVVLTIASRV